MARILIIDDDAQNREILGLRLRHYGHAVEEAACGEDGLLAARTAPPDLVFLDVMMPKMDGWQICRALKADASTRRVPVVMLTSLNRQLEELRGWESGADEYVTKPWSGAHILEIVEKFVGGATGDAS